MQDYLTEKYWETRGIKDLNQYTPSVFRKSTGDEQNGHLPANAQMGRYIHPGGESVIKALKDYASVTEAALVDVEDGYAGTPIYVRTSPSSPQVVTNSGGVVTNNADGSTTYGFPGGTYYPSKFVKLDADQVQQGNYQGASVVATHITSVGERVHLPSNPTKAKVPSGYRYQKYLPVSDTWINVTIPSNWYDCTSWDYFYTYPSYEYWGYYPSSGNSGGGGNVTVKPYTPEVVRGQRLQQGVLTQAKTEDLPFDYYTYIPSGAIEETKTVLAGSGSTAVQNFAFDGMDDID